MIPKSPMQGSSTSAGGRCRPHSVRPSILQEILEAIYAVPHRLIRDAALFDVLFGQVSALRLSTSTPALMSLSQFCAVSLCSTHRCTSVQQFSA